MTEPAYPNLLRCQWCGDMLLSKLARDVHEPQCDDNPNKPKDEGDD